MNTSEEDKTEYYLSVKLTGSEVDIFEQAKDKSGIRSAAEFVRYLIKQYLGK